MIWISSTVQVRNGNADAMSRIPQETPEVMRVMSLLEGSKHSSGSCLVYLQVKIAVKKQDNLESCRSSAISVKG